MRTLATVFVVAMFATVVLSAALFAAAITALPYVVIGNAIALLIRARQRPTTVNQLPQRHAPATYRVPRQIAPSGWVYVPVWVGPPPQSATPVIDGEVIEDLH